MLRLALTLLLVLCCPANLTPLAIDDTNPVVGDTLHASGDTWDDPAATVTYQWSRCPGDETTCTGIPGATGTAYTVVAADARNRLRVRATATNAGAESATSDSALTEVVPDVPPQNTAKPTITGTPRSGQTLTAQDGTWSGTPPAVARQWLRCDGSGGACAAIAGATGPTLVLGGADESPPPPSTSPTATTPLTASFSGRPQRADLARALERRLNIRGRCSGPCRVAVRLAVTKRAARKWRVPRTVAAGRRALAAAGTAIVRPRFAKTTQERLRPVRKLVVVVTAQARDGAGKLVAQRSWRLTLTREPAVSR